MSQQVAVTVRYREVALMRRAVVDDVDESGGFLHTDVPMPVGSLIELAPADGEQADDEIERVTARVEQVIEQPRRQQQSDSKRPGMRLRFTSQAGVEALLASAGELAIELAEPEAIGGKRRTYHANAPAFRTASRAEAAALRHIATAEAQAELLRQNEAGSDSSADDTGDSDDAPGADDVADDANTGADSAHGSDQAEGYGDSADATEVAARPGGLDEAATVIDAAPDGDAAQPAPDAYVFEAAEPDESDVPPAHMMRFGRDPTGDTPMLSSASGEIGGPEEPDEEPTREDTERIETAELEATTGDAGEAKAGDDDVVEELRARRKTAFYGAVSKDASDDDTSDDADSGDDDDSGDDGGDDDGGDGGGGDGDGDSDDQSETTSSKRRRKRRGRKRKR